MTYYFSKMVDMDFGAAVAATKDALQRHNFTVVAEIDMKSNLEKALNIDFRPYLILGACHPAMTYRALEAEDKIGTMLPCNLVLQQRQDGKTEVSAVDPISSVEAIHHVVLGQFALDIRSELQHVIDDIPSGAGAPAGPPVTSRGKRTASMAADPPGAGATRQEPAAAARRF